MIDLRTEKLISLTDAARLPVLQLLRVSEWSVRNWARRGVHGVKLETVRVGQRRCTSVEAVHRFVEAITLQADGAGAPVQTGEYTPTDRDRERVRQLLGELA